MSDRFEVLVAAEPVAIPYRVYLPELSEQFTTSLGETERLMLDCIYSRHSSGYVRQRALDRIVGYAEPWVVPFVVQLVGEYVEQIIEVIDERLGDLSPSDARREPYRAFVVENPTFMRLTSARVDSYWNCFYRDKYLHRAQHPNRSDYPGYRVLKTLRDIR